MSREFAKKFYASRAWRDCRAAFFQMRFGLCERCSGPGKIVHHKIYLTEKNINDPYIALSFDNLELLCQECHNREHNEKYSATRFDVQFDENGDLIEYHRDNESKYRGPPM